MLNTYWTEMLTSFIKFDYFTGPWKILKSFLTYNLEADILSLAYYIVHNQIIPKITN